ncbi:MAG TPA: hypothetical protein VNJ70_09065 [Thermoanaerobaculia bacterium]|nr:hypothetical protein [Thermoanaerobaculia bacterium]
MSTVEDGPDGRDDERMTAVLRSKTGAERLRIASGMVAAARRMLASHLAAERPDWDERRIQDEVARRIAGGTG